MSPTIEALYQTALQLPRVDQLALGHALIEVQEPTTDSLDESRQRPMTGAEIVAFLQAEGLIGYRTDITDSQEHARMLREKAQRRNRM